MVAVTPAHLRRARRPMRATHVGLLAAAIGASLAVFAARATEPLNLEQALQLAQNRSQGLVAQDNAALAAREMAVCAGQLPDPTLKIGINNLPVNGPDAGSLTRDFMTMRTIGVMQEIMRADKRQARAARYERQAEAAHASRELTLANLQRDMALAWLDRYDQEQMREVLATQRDEARLQVEATDSAYRAGRGSQADVFAARTAVAQLEDRIAVTERLVSTASKLPASRRGERTKRSCVTVGAFLETFTTARLTSASSTLSQCSLRSFGQLSGSRRLRPSFDEFKQPHSSEHGGDEDHRLGLAHAHRDQSGTRAKTGDAPADSEQEAAANESAVDVTGGRHSHGLPQER